METGPTFEQSARTDSCDNTPKDPGRRGFVATAANTAMAGGLFAAYGTFGAYAVRYLYPPDSGEPLWIYVAVVRQIKAGQSINYTAPSGERIAIARQGDTGKVDDFIALSSTCPHLGCQVHWQGAKNRFFCPCHNGVFDKKGRGIGGPPGEAGQNLAQFPLKIDSGLLYIQAPTTTLASATTMRSFADGRDIAEKGTA